MSPDEPKEYAHGCGSPQQCQMAEVMAGYQARSAAKGKPREDLQNELEGRSRSYMGPQVEKATRHRRR